MKQMTYARTTGKKSAIRLVTSGPGATNLVTDRDLRLPIMTVFRWSVLPDRYGETSDRNDAFGMDIVGITRSITKYVTVTKRRSWTDHHHEAFYIARTGRPGPPDRSSEDVMAELGSAQYPEVEDCDISRIPVYISDS